MKMPIFHRLVQGQTALEYLLLLAAVAVVVIASFNSGGLVDQTRTAAQGYYNSVTTAIMGNNNTNPQQIHGNWCPVSCPALGSGPTTLYRACECPAPAFGGYNCTDARNPNTGGTGGTANC